MIPFHVAYRRVLDQSADLTRTHCDRAVTQLRSLLADLALAPMRRAQRDRLDRPAPTRPTVADTPDTPA